MNMETKIHATVRMYLQAYEQRFDNPELLQKWAKRADALYEEMHKTKYNMTYVREHLFFCMANAPCKKEDMYQVLDVKSEKLGEIVNRRSMKVLQDLTADYPDEKLILLIREVIAA